jgi:diguanylate cyclase (GGDEF)-like protein
MSASHITIPDAHVEQRAQSIQTDIRAIGRQNWSLWVLAIVVILSLTVAVATMSVQVMTDQNDPFYQFRISQAVRGLVGLVLLFSCYTLYQQVQLRRTRQRLADQVAISAEKHQLAQEYLKLAMLDPLTGLHNRRYAQERLVAEISRSQRLGSSLTVLMLDLDGLKQINDNHGHGAGDMALKTFGERLRRAIRGSDLAVRMGGDEFMALLPECRLAEVRLVLGRLSELNAEFEDQKFSFRFSAGWADYQNGETPDQLVQRADNALYAEKQARKSQTEIVA